MYRKSTRERFFPDLYFDSGGRRIDYVIVYSMKQILERENKRNSLANFVDYLISRDIHIEHSYHSKNRDLGFIKIHVPQEILEGYADAINMDLNFKMHPIPMVNELALSKCRRTPLSYRDERSIMLKRAKETIGAKRPKSLTQAERILLTHLMLQDVQFGAHLVDKGLGTLQARKIVKDSFALHEGPTYLTPRGPLTDRQLLAAYWGNVRNILKDQPIDVIHKYFGPNVAFYFSFLAFFNNMLISASIMAILLPAIGYLTNMEGIERVGKIYCTSDKYLCPSCDPRHCRIWPLKSYCPYFKVIYLYDNNGSLFLSIFMSLWGKVFFELWDRRRNLSIIKWHLSNLESDVTMRMQYEEKCDVLIYSPVTGLLEPTMSTIAVTWRYIIVVMIMTTLVMLVLYFMSVAIYLRVVLYKYSVMYFQSTFMGTYRRVIVDSSAAIAQVFFIIVIDKIKHPTVRFMTDLQNCRTEIEYNNSFIAKLWMIGFVNVYAVLFYTAFFKGMFYTNPGDRAMYEDENAIKADLCSPPGCNQDLVIIILFLILFKTLLVKFAGKVFYPLIKRSLRRKKTITSTREPQWEKDFRLEKVRDIDVLEDFSEIVGRFTMVLFMTSVFPLAPLITLICNSIEERIDANRYLNTKRRSIPRKVTGLGIWYYIMKFIAIFSVLVNALTSVFTKEYLAFVYHAVTTVNASASTFIDTRFSEFSVDDFTVDHFIYAGKNLTKCVYHKAYRNPPEHPEKYELSSHRYPLLSFQLCFAVVFQHAVFWLSHLITKLIPNTTAELKEYLHRQVSEERKMLRKHRNLQYMRNQVSKGSSRRVTIGN
ncbi:hypothetical protein WA026_010234 [Henosepilachna vigintioctopunctata]|uniref:Anoctamin n=1 Tax=Henosepilachna vigintioctopunctata TaxID=420089 RepID=A0AAW1UGY2_9CUCU